MDWENTALSAVAVPVSLACLGYALWQLFRVARLRRSGTRAPGTISSMKEVKMLHTRTRQLRTWKMLVSFRFQAVDGRSVETDYLVAKPEFSPGHEVTVAYDPANPENAVLMESTLHLRKYAFWTAASVLFVAASAWWLLIETGVVSTMV